MGDFDIIYVGDFTSRSDATSRVVEEALMNAELGYRTGLVHIASDDGFGAPVLPEILELVNDAIAVSLEYSTAITAKLIIIIDPASTLSLPPRLPVRVSAEHVLAVLDGPATLDLVAHKNERFIQHFGDVVTWTATAYDVLALLQASGLRTLGTIWQPFGFVRATPSRYMRKTSRPIIGTVAGPGAEHWPYDPAVIGQVWDGSQYRVRVMGQPPATGNAGDWDILEPGERSPVRFASSLDALLYYPDGRPDDLPLTAIGACLAADIPVFLPPHLKPAVSKGPRYAALRDVPGALRHELTTTSRASTPRFDAIEAHKRRMRFWLKTPSTPLPCRQRKALFLTSNGDGLGHVTRLLGVARKMQSNVTPVFATLSLGVGIIQDAGYHAELILSHRYAGLEERDAYPWMAVELDEILSRHAPDVVVFDGGNPYEFVLEGVAARRRHAFLWMRRAMWRKEQDNTSVIAKEKFFDAVIEPSDFAESWDKGATVARRDGVVVVDPIRLLDETEQLPRDEARAALGLNQKDPAVLIQLGPGNQRDVSITLRHVLSAFEDRPDVQLVNLNAPISRHPASHFERVKEVSIYPMARYLQAFDFAISAAGYNSFHELLAGAIPTIFVVTPRPELDDQESRAQFAEAMGLGFALTDGDVFKLPPLVDRLLSDTMLCDSMRRNCGRLEQNNGARQAADLIAEFAR